LELKVGRDIIPSNPIPNNFHSLLLKFEFIFLKWMKISLSQII